MQLLLSLFLGSLIGLEREAKGKEAGLTTAAGLWVVAAIGVAVGPHLYFLAILTSFLTIFVLSGFALLEGKIFKKG